MKLFRYLLLSAVLCVCFSAGSLAQDESKFEEKSSPQLKYFKEKYEETFKTSFEETWKAVLKSIEENNCQVIKKTTKQGDGNLLKGVAHSDFGVFATGSYSYDSLNTYVYPKKMPFIRGGDWINARVQYKIFVKELKDGGTSVEVTAELSGMERYVTGEVHFMQSNGYFETGMMNRIKSKLVKP